MFRHLLFLTAVLFTTWMASTTGDIFYKNKNKAKSKQYGFNDRWPQTS